MQLFGSKQESPDEFWRRTEEELGESVRLYTVGRCTHGCVDDGNGEWGLFFLTDRALYFRHFPSANWFSALIKSSTSGSQLSEGVYFSISRGDISEVEIEHEPSLLRRIFRYSPPAVRISYRDEHHQSAVLRFIPESKAEKFKEMLSTE